MSFGVTFSHRHFDMLSIDIDFALQKLIDLKIKYIRIGLYWDEIEKFKDKYDFVRVKKILDFCEINNIFVMPTIGCKAPRLPEFYFPFWIKNPYKSVLSLDKSETFLDSNRKDQESLFNFISVSILELKKYSCIFSWQIENEPLDPSPPFFKSIPIEILRKEIEIAKNLDSRPIHINFWGNDFVERNLLAEISDEIDTIGVDLYFYIRNFFNYDSNLSKSKVKEIFDILKNSGKEFWITELQAEPWEFLPFEFKLLPFYEKKLRENPKAFLKTTNIVGTKFKTKSMDIEKLKKNFEIVKTIGFENIFFWGFEYWLWREKEFGDRSYLELFKEYNHINK